MILKSPVSTATPHFLNQVFDWIKLLSLELKTFLASELSIISPPGIMSNIY